MSRTDAAGVIDYVNQVFCDVCGYSTEELLGSPHNYSPSRYAKGDLQSALG